MKYHAETSEGKLPPASHHHSAFSCRWKFHFQRRQAHCKSCCSKDRSHVSRTCMAKHSKQFSTLLVSLPLKPCYEDHVTCSCPMEDLRCTVESILQAQLEDSNGFWDRQCWMHFLQTIGSTEQEAHALLAPWSWCRPRRKVTTPQGPTT